MSPRTDRLFEKKAMMFINAYFNDCINKFPDALKSNQIIHQKGVTLTFQETIPVNDSFQDPIFEDIFVKLEANKTWLDLYNLCREEYWDYGTLTDIKISE